MPLKSANDFVCKMRDDKGFRDEIRCIPNEENLEESLRKQGFSFQIEDLVKAIATCMDNMERSSEINNKP